MIALSKKGNKQRGHVKELGLTTKRINWLLVAIGHHNKDKSGSLFCQGWGEYTGFICGIKNWNVMSAWKNPLNLLLGTDSMHKTTDWMIIYFMLCNVEILPSCKHIVIFAIVKMFIIHSLVGEDIFKGHKIRRTEVLLFGVWSPTIWNFSKFQSAYFLIWFLSLSFSFFSSISLLLKIVRHCACF